MFLQTPSRQRRSPQPQFEEALSPKINPEEAGRNVDLKADIPKFQYSTMPEHSPKKADGMDQPAIISSSMDLVQALPSRDAAVVKSESSQTAVNFADQQSQSK